MIDQDDSSFTSTTLATYMVHSNRSSTAGRSTYVRLAQVIFIATLVSLGVCGNIICAIVFSTKSLRRIRSSAYLFTLALIDVFFLLDLLPGMIHMAFVSDLYRKLTLVCYIQTYISFVASFIHIWMVLAFTAERFFAVNFPLKHMSQCTPQLSRAVIFIITIPAFLFYIHPAFFVSKVDQKGQCREKLGYERYLNNLNIIDTIMTMFLPFIVVSILNILIIRKLFCTKTFRQHVFANGSRYQCRRTSNWKSNAKGKTTSTASTRPQRSIRPFHSPAKKLNSLSYRTFQNNTNVETSPSNITPQTKTATTSESSSSSTFRSKNVSIRRHDSAQRHILTELRLTKMLLAISLTCIALNFPSYYIRFAFFYQGSTEDSALPPSSPPPSQSSTNKTTSNNIDLSLYRDVISHYLSYLSYSINIVIYLLFGGNFRRALRRLFSFESARPEHLHARLQGQQFVNHEKIYGNSFEYDSTGLTSILPDTSLRVHPSLRRTLRNQNAIS